MSRLAAAVLVSLLAAAPGWSEARLAAPCRSIVDASCGPPQRVTAKGNLRVEVITRRRSLVFPLSAAADPEEDRASWCPDGKCRCDEQVQHFDFKGPVPGFRQVNDFEMRAAAGMKCSIDNSAVSREAQHFAVSAHFVSTAVFELEYCRTCGGSCHGRTVLATYDAAYGATVRLRDAVPLARMAALKLRLVDAFVFANFASRDRLLQRERLLKALASRSFADDGMYVERGKVFVNLDLFALSCADGSFYPLMVPAEFLTPSFRQRAV